MRRIPVVRTDRETAAVRQAQQPRARGQATLPRGQATLPRGQATLPRGQKRAEVHAARRAALLSIAIAAATAAVVALAGGGDAVWICVPAALLAAGGSGATGGSGAAGASGATGGFGATRTTRATRRRIGAALSAGVVVGAAIAAERASAHGGAPAPGIAMTLFVPVASVAVMIAGRERLERERDALRASALSDPLTGVANRRALLDRIHYEIARHGRTRHSFAVLMLDLDGFKLLNDRFGHPAGDDLLREVARALAGAIRDQDTLARVGGDEFCVLAPETDQAGANRLVARVETAVARVVAGVDALGASAGAALFPRDGGTADALLEAADQRLLGAKRHSRTSPRRRHAA